MDNLLFKTIPKLPETLVGRGYFGQLHAISPVKPDDPNWDYNKPEHSRVILGRFYGLPTVNKNFVMVFNAGKSLRMTSPVKVIVKMDHNKIVFYTNNTCYNLTYIEGV